MSPRGTARPRWRSRRPPPGPAPRSGAQLALFTDGGRVAAPLVPLAEIPAAAPVPVRRLSYSALALYGRCGYRYFAQRVLGLPEPVIAAAPDAGLGPLEVGDAVHLELERPDGRWRDLYPSATEADVERIAGFVAAWSECSLRGRVDAPRPRPAGGAVRVRGRRRALPRPVRHLRARGRRLGAGRRLQDEPPGRARGAGRDGPLLRGAGDDLRAGRAAHRGAGGRGRLRLPRARRRGRDAAVRGGRRRGARGRAAGGDRGDPRRPLPGPARARTAASARRSTCSAPGPGLEWQG